MTKAQRSFVDEFEVVELINDYLRTGVVPELGAKIVSLVHLRTGREWMWKPEQNPQYFRVSTETPFDEGPFLGADECLPTVAACRWRSRDLPDHGEAWSQPWTIDEDQLADGRISTRLKTPISPLVIERTLSLDDDQVRFDYQLENLDDQPQEYLWALHPMMTIEKGDRILLPETCQHVRVGSSLGGCPLGACGEIANWPRPAPELDLSRLDLGGDKRAAKLYTAPLTDGQATIFNETTGESLDFLFNSLELDTLGIWINQGGFGGHYHIALEPTNAETNSLALAVEEGKRFGRLAPRETKRWTLILRLSVA